MLLPRSLRRDAAIIYGYCRLADDAVDTSPDPVGGLRGLRQQLDKIYSDVPLQHPVDRAFRVVVTTRGIPRAVPEALLEGFAWDLEGRTYETVDETIAYGVRVASTVGLMMTLAMGVRDPHALARACELGVAMQLTNIARDVGEDARAGRIYLPLEWLRQGGVSPEEFLRRPAATAGVTHAVRRLLREADWLYGRADAGVPMLPCACRPAIRAARLIYAEIGTVIAQRGYDSVQRRAVVSGPRKARLLAEALVPRPAHWSARARPPLPQVAPLIDAVVALGTP